MAFWAINGAGFGAANLAAIGTFGVAYMVVVLIEPLADLAVLGLAKSPKGKGRALSPRAFTQPHKTRRRGLASGRAKLHKAGMIVTLCHSCALGQSGFADTLRAALDGAGVVADVRTTDCMSGCTRPSTCAARATGKTAYLFGDLTADDLPDLLTFALHYAASPDGNLADARVLGGLRMKAIARIPA